MDDGRTKIDFFLENEKILWSFLLMRRTIHVPVPTVGVVLMPKEFNSESAGILPFHLDLVFQTRLIR